MLILKNKRFLLAGALVLIGLAGLAWAAQKHGHRGHHHNGAGHDEVNMPGLRGVDTTAAEVDDMKKMFRQHGAIQRTVVNLPNGVRTTTESADPELRAAVVAHVVGMIARVEAGRDPQVLIQSPTLDAVFKGRDRIQTELTMTTQGVQVVQTSSDPALVKVLQVHAAEVSDMAARGMAAVHERMASTSRPPGR
jgi:hypothetical protein